MEILHHLNDTILKLITENPYLWIFILMTLESTIVPIPSEIVMPPAWYFASQWHLNIWIAILMWVLWSICWASICYAIAYFGWEKLSKKILWEKYHNLWINFFSKDGNMTTFVGRLLPWIRHFIAFPAWLFKMNYKNFVIFTALGSWIWVSFLAWTWFYAWQNAELIHKYKLWFGIGIILLAVFMVAIKIYLIRKFSKNS